MKKDLSEEELKELAVKCIERDVRSFSPEEVKTLLSHLDELKGFFEGMASFVETTAPTIPAYQKKKRSLGKLPTRNLREMLLSLATQRSKKIRDDDRSRDAEIHATSDEIVIRDILWERGAPTHSFH